MKNLAKMLVITTFIAVFITYPVLLPINKIELLNSGTSPFVNVKDGKEHTDLRLNNNVTSFFNDTFFGFLYINNSVIQFNHCTFENWDPIEIYGNSTVSFVNSCAFALSAAVQVYGEATVTIQDASLTSTAGIAIYNATAHIENSSLELTSLDVYGAANMTLQNASLDLTSLHVYDTANLTVAACQLLVDVYLKINGTATVAFIGCPAINVSIDTSSDSVSISSNAIFTSSALHLNVELSDEIWTLLEIAGSAQFTDSTVTVDGVFNRSKNIGAIFVISGVAVFSNSAVTTHKLEVTGTVTFNESSTLSITGLPMYLDLFEMASAHLHRFVVGSNGNLTIEESTVTCPASLLEVKDYAQLTLRDQSDLTMNLPIQISECAQMTVEGNSVLNIAEIFVCNTTNDYYAGIGKDNNTGTLIINSSTVYGTIIDTGVNTSVTVHDSNVSTLGVYLFINGANQVTIENNTITYNMTTPWNKTITPTGDYTVNETLFCIAALHTASVLINASQIYGVLAGWNTNITLVDSTVSALVAAANNASITADNVTISGNGGATLEYGSLGVYNAYYIRKISGPDTPVFAFQDSDIRGNILFPYGSSSTFTGCEFDLTYLKINGTTSSAFHSCNFTLSNSLPAKPLHLHTTVNATFTNCTFWNMTSMDSSLYPATLENTGTYTFANCSFAFAVLTIANTTTTTFHGRLDFVQCGIAGAMILGNRTTLVLQRSSYETLEYLSDSQNILVLERFGPHINISGLVTNQSSLNETILSANLTVNNITVTADSNDPLHFTLDPLTYQVPGLATCAIIAYNTTGYSDANVTRNFTITIPADAPVNSTIWETTADFNTWQSPYDSTIRMNQILLGTIQDDFTDENSGDDPTDWTILEEPNTDVTIQSVMVGHSKVVELRDDSGTYHCSMYNSFAAQPIGTVELWVYCKPGAESMCYIWLRDGTSNGIYLVLDYLADALNYYDSEGYKTLMAGFSENAWYHLRIAFNCTNSTFELWVNGTQQGAAHGFKENQTTIDNFYVRTSTRGAYGNACLYVDAVDYSWTYGYVTNRSWSEYGQNKYELTGSWTSATLDMQRESPYYETIQVSYTNNTNTSVSISYQMKAASGTWGHYDWSSYSWVSGWSPGSPGNLTLALVGKQYFELRVYLNTSDEYQTPRVSWICVTAGVCFDDLQWNSSDEFEEYEEMNCTILNGELILTETPIAFDFTDQAPGDPPPDDWVLHEDANTQIQVETNISTHLKVVKLNDNNSGGYCSMTDTFSARSNGTIELWIHCEPGTQSMGYIWLRDGTSNGIYLVLDYDIEELKFYDSEGYKSLVTGFKVSQWYHLRITFDCVNDTFDLWVNGTLQGAAYGFKENRTELDTLIIRTSSGGAHGNARFYADAIDYQWVAGYFEGRSYTYYGQPLYASAGLWTSNSQDLNKTTPYYTALEFVCQTDASTSVGISYQMSHDNNSWAYYNGSVWNADWSAWAETNSSLNVYGRRYFQVRAKLTTTDITKTPTLYNITVQVYYF